MLTIDDHELLLYPPVAKTSAGSHPFDGKRRRRERAHRFRGGPCSFRLECLLLGRVLGVAFGLVAAREQVVLGQPGTLGVHDRRFRNDLFESQQGAIEEGNEEKTSVDGKGDEMNEDETWPGRDEGEEEDEKETEE